MSESNWCAAAENPSPSSSSATRLRPPATSSGPACSRSPSGAGPNWSRRAIRTVPPAMCTQARTPPTARRIPPTAAARPQSAADRAASCPSAGRSRRRSRCARGARRTSARVGSAGPARPGGRRRRCGRSSRHATWCPRGLEASHTSGPGANHAAVGHAAPRDGAREASFGSWRRRDGDPKRAHRRTELHRRPPMVADRLRRASSEPASGSPSSSAPMTSSAHRRVSRPAAWRAANRSESPPVGPPSLLGVCPLRGEWRGTNLRQSGRSLTFVDECT